MNFLALLLLFTILLATVASQGIIREKRGLRKAFRAIRDSALPSFGAAAGVSSGPFARSRSHAPEIAALEDLTLKLNSVPPFADIFLARTYTRRHGGRRGSLGGYRTYGPRRFMDMDDTWYLNYLSEGK
ncbi:unnamed protein product [Caenorhabditis sp. 36 PRJEB53466]|nr:unnamed protein product [Caenorhabditis sp. 36 PRJEB53466]